MKMFGSWKELVKVVFRTDTQEVELQPDSATTYTATRTISLPPGDTNQSLVGSASTQTLTNKTIDGDDNTLQDISISSLKTVLGDANEALVRDGSGAVVSALIANANISGSAAIDATKLADGSVSNTELQYINSLTSNAQDQIDGKVSSGTLTAHTGASSGVHGVTGSVVGTTDTQTLTNKSLVDTSTKFVDATDSSIQVEILSNGTASTKTSLIAVQSANRNITLPDASTTLVGTDNTQNLSGKNFTDSPSFDVGLLLDHTATPSTPTGAVAVYSKNDNKVYKKGADGIESEIGSGSGQGTLNIVDNASADSGTTGWTAATNYTVTRNTTDSPLEGVIDTCFAISTTTASTESSTSGVYAASLANPVAFQNMKLQLSMYVTTPASSLGVWRVSVYNSGGTRVALSTDSSGVTTLPGGFNGQFAASFDSDSGATYTVSITQTTRTSANTLYATNISISNSSLVQGAVVGTTFNLVPFGASWAGFGSKGVSSFTCVGQRIGSNLKVNFNITTNAVAAGAGAGNLRLTMPAAFAADFTGYPSYVGSSSTYGFTAALTFDESVPVYSESTTQYRFVKPGTGAYLTTADANNTNIQVLDGEIVFPVAAWIGSGTVNLGENDVEYAYNTAVSNASDSTSFAYGPAGGALPNGAPSGQILRRVRFQSPIQATDALIFEIDMNNTGNWTSGPWMTAAQFLIAPYQTYSGLVFPYGAGGLAAVSGSRTDVDCYFGRYPARENATDYNWGVSYPGKWRLKKVKAGAAVGFGEATSSSLGLVKKNRFQKKNLSASNAGTVSFNNLLSGQYYRLAVHAEIVTTTTANSQGFVTCNDANVAGSGQELVYFNATTANQAGVVVSSFNQVYLASTSTLTLTTGLLNGASLATGFAILEEVNDLVVTTDFT